MHACQQAEERSNHFACMCACSCVVCVDLVPSSPHLAWGMVGGGYNGHAFVHSFVHACVCACMCQWICVCVLPHRPPVVCGVLGEGCMLECICACICACMCACICACMWGNWCSSLLSVACGVIDGPPWSPGLWELAPSSSHPTPPQPNQPNQSKPTITRIHVKTHGFRTNGAEYL